MTQDFKRHPPTRFTKVENLRRDEAGEEMAALREGIDRARNPRLDRFIYALGIRHVGERIARVLARELGSLPALRRAGTKDLEALPEIGPEIAESVAHFFREKRNRKILGRLFRAGITVQPPAKPQGRPLSGKTLVFTGSLESYRRSRAKARVEALGGRATTAVSDETDYLVVGARPGSKLEEARKRDVPRLDEAAFKELVGDEP